ncbi:MAG: hypothetical protein ABSD59_10745 [Terracidiphilus sp.]|jgi:O-antigen/teichoic acid export membrane protein
MTETLKTEARQDRDAGTRQWPAAFSLKIGGMGRQRLRVVVSQSVSAISDQGFFALGNFAVTTILARQMSKTSFGHFSAAFAAFMLLSPLYCGLISDPMLVYGASTAKRTQRSYVRQVVSLHWGTALAISALLLGIGFIQSQTRLGQGSFLAYLGWAIAAPAVLRLWLARRTAYLMSKPQYSAFAGGVYLIIIAALLVAFGRHLTTSVVVPCFFIAATSLIVGFLLHRSLRLVDIDTAPFNRTLEVHWKFGKWAGSAGVLSLLPDYVFFFVLSPELCGQYRALLNVVLPLTQIYSALGILMTAYFARHRESADFTGIVLRTAAAFCAAAVLIAAVVVTLGGRLFSHLYAGKYDLRFTLLLPLAIVSVLFAVKAVSDAVLRSLENVTSLAVVAVVGAIAAMVLGAPLGIRYGIWGAVYGDLLVYAILTVAIVVIWIQSFKLTRMNPKSTGKRAPLGSVPYPQLAVAETPIEPFAESRL